MFLSYWPCFCWQTYYYITQDVCMRSCIILSWISPRFAIPVAVVLVSSCPSICVAWVCSGHLNPTFLVSPVQHPAVVPLFVLSSAHSVELSVLVMPCWCLKLSNNMVHVKNEQELKVYHGLENTYFLNLWFCTHCPCYLLVAYANLMNSLIKSCPGQLYKIS